MCVCVTFCISVCVVSVVEQVSLSFCLYVRYALSCVLGVGSGACFVIYVHVVKSELSEPSLTVDIHVFFSRHCGLF